MHPQTIFFFIAALCWLGSGWVEAQSRSEGVALTFEPSLYQALEYRSIGPPRGGRAPTVAGVPGELFTFYMGTSGGGVWKTTDAGTTWNNISTAFSKPVRSEPLPLPVCLGAQLR